MGNGSLCLACHTRVSIDFVCLFVDFILFYLISN